MSALASPCGSSLSSSESSDSDRESDPGLDLASPSCSSSKGEDSPRKKSRKRQRRVDKWKATQRKKCQNLGEPYISKIGKQVRSSAKVYCMYKLAEPIFK